MRLNPNMPGDVAANPAAAEDREDGTKADFPALIGMSLRQDIPGGLLSSRARFRFSCQGHSETKDARRQQKRSERRTVPSCRVSKLDTPHPRLPSGLVTELVTQSAPPSDRFACKLASMMASFSFKNVSRVNRHSMPLLTRLALHARFCRGSFRALCLHLAPRAAPMIYLVSEYIYASFEMGQ